MNGPTRIPPSDALQVVILDCDGVLFHSERANIAYYNEALARAGEPPLDAVGERLCHSLSGDQLFTRLFEDDARRARVVAAAAGIDYTPFFELMEPARDLEQCLGTLAARCSVALATNRGRTVSGLITRFGFDRFFRVWLGILDVARPKPAPDLLLTCLERCKAPAAAAVYVGDSLVDRDAATAANVAYVGIGEESGARWRIRELAELPRLLFGDDQNASRERPSDAR